MRENLTGYYTIFSDEELNELINALNSHLGTRYHVGSIPFVNENVALMAILKQAEKVKPVKKVYKMPDYAMSYKEDAKVPSFQAADQVEIPNDHFLIIAQVITKLRNPYRYLHLERMGIPFL